HPTSFNIPMHVTYSVVRDLSLTEDLLSDLKTLCEFYSGAVDRVRLREQWGEAITYMDKIKVRTLFS
ncbi:mpn domain-containing protein, partial [Plakobranchus ocellatus]